MTVTGLGRYGTEALLTNATPPLLVRSTAVTVWVTGTMTAPTLYTDLTGAVVAANPVTSGADGSFSFHALAGVYDLAIGGVVVATVPVPISTSGATFTGPVYVKSGPYIDVDSTADPTGVSDSTAAFAAALTSIISGGGVMRPRQGTFKVNLGGLPTVTNPKTAIRGPGSKACVIRPQGTAGDLLRIQTSPFSAVQAGFLSGVTIDGADTSGSAAISGVHLGDTTGFDLEDVVIQGFVTSHGYGLWLDNQTTFTERTSCRRLWLNNNTVGLRATHGTIGGALTASFDYTRFQDLRLNVNNSQVGIQFEGASNFTRGWFLVNANLDSDANTILWNLLGTSQVNDVRVEVLGEQTSGSGGTGRSMAAGAIWAPSYGSVWRVATATGNLPNAYAAGAYRTLDGGVNTVAAAGAATVDADTLYQNSVVTVNVSANSTLTVTNPSFNQRITFVVAVGAGGPFTFGWPGDFLGAQAINTAATKISVQTFYYASSGFWYSLGPLQTIN